jgi:hypothetical protein
VRDFLEELKNPWIVEALLAMVALIVILLNVRISVA